MEKSLVFPVVEFQHRLERVQRLMQEDDLDSLLVTEDRNFFYFTGFDGGVQVARPRILLIPATGNPVILIAPNYETCMRESTWIEDIRIYTVMTRAPIAETVAAIREFPRSSGRVGAELGYEQRLGVTYNDIERLRQEATGLKIVDGSAVLWHVRMIKSSREIECHRKAIEITDQAFPIAFSQVQAGMSEKDITALFNSVLKACGAHSAGAYVVTGKGDYFRSMGTPRSRPVERDEMVWVDSSASWNGYFSDFSRAAVVGSPTTEQVDLQARIHEITMIGVEAICPGVRACDVALQLDTEMDRRGLLFNSGALRYGHGMGLLTTEPPHVAEYDRTVVEPGMILTVEPAMHTEFGRFNVEENVLVTESGSKCLSQTDRTIRVID